MAISKYRALRPDKIIETQQRLQQRIVKRFPASGLSEVASDLQKVAEEAVARAELIRRPNVPLRIGVAILLLAGVVLAVIIARSIKVRADLEEALNLAQFVEAGLGAIVFIGLGVLFLITLEMRWKRRRALAALHELRAIAHVVDMHQLAKDPDGLLHRGRIVSEAPTQTTKTLHELNRYLNYCNELLAIISKVAALYVQNFPDASTVAAVDNIESLCLGLSQKIWQKIMVLEEILDEPTARGADTAPVGSASVSAQIAPPQ
jgi:hypothetical protein